VAAGAAAAVVAATAAAVGTATERLAP
jgi:hypothetical protein